MKAVPRMYVMRVDFSRALFESKLLNFWRVVVSLKFNVLALTWWNTFSKNKKEKQSKVTAAISDTFR